MRDATSQGDHFVVSDAQGNVTTLVDAVTGLVSGALSYDPFGRVIAATGVADAVMPLRFQTQYHDAETGLAYFLNRYHDPRLGRWLSRDPIGEPGGLNLYGFASNVSVTPSAVER